MCAPAQCTPEQTLTRSRLASAMQRLFISHPMACTALLAAAAATAAAADAAAPW